MDYSSRPRRYCSAVLVLVSLASGCSTDDSEKKGTTAPRACQFAQDSQLPVPTGTYCIGIRELNWQSDTRDPLSPDGTRNRELGVRIYYPARTDAQGKPAMYFDAATAANEARLLTEATQNPAMGAALQSLKTHGIELAPVAEPPPPAAETAPGTPRGFPVLVYSPGWGGQHQQMTAVLEDLTSHGFVVIALNHPYVSGFVPLSDGTYALGATEEAASDTNLLGEQYRVVRSDIEFALDELVSLSENDRDPLGCQLDVTRIGVLGHSLGGGAAVTTLAKDPRVDAAVNMDGSITFGTEPPPANDKPMLLMLAGEHTLAFDPEVNELWRKHTGEAFRVEISDAGHISFIDYGLLAQPYFSGPLPADEFGTIAPAHMLEVQRKALHLFFDAALNGKPASQLNELVEPAHVKVTARIGDQWVEPPQNASFYLSMSDGIRIAVDLWLPADASVENRYPTLIRATRYWRDQGVTNPTYRSQTGPAQEAIGWASRGFAVLNVDARGSGASFGTRAHPWSAQEVKDYGEIVNWLVQQPWSDGQVGAHGISYEGNTAALIGMLGNPAVKAVSPQYGDMDVMTDIAAPGGVLNVGFLSAWMTNNQQLDQNDLCGGLELNEVECSEARQVLTGVKPVDSDTDQSLLRAAVAEHRNSPDQLGPALSLEASDDPFNGATLAQLSPARRMDVPGWGDTAVMLWASWTDAGTARGALERFRASKGPITVMIGAVSHGGEHDTDPFHPAEAPQVVSSELQAALLFGHFATHLKGIPSTLPARGVRYYTLGTDEFSFSETWPPPGGTMKPFYLHAGGQLNEAPPTGVEASDNYSVDYSTTTGMTNRWWTQMGGGDVAYGDRAAEDKKLLVYETLPLDRDMLVTGTAEVTLHVASTHDDGAVFAYLEDVAPDGTATYVTEGQLRLRYRAISSPAPEGQLGPYHSLRRADGAPMVPGVSEPVRIGLEPTSVLFRAGHRVRLAIAGHDASCFKRIPAEGQPVWTIAHQSTQVSALELPVMPTKTP